MRRASAHGRRSARPGSTVTFCCSLISRITEKICFTISGARPERRLVEQQQARPAHQRAADRQHLLLAAGQGAAALVPALLAGAGTARTRARRSALEMRRRGGDRAHLQVLEHRHARERCGALPATGRCRAGRSSWVGTRRDVLAVEQRSARTRRAGCRRSSSAGSTCRRRWRRSASRSRPRRTSMSTPCSASIGP